MIAFSHFSICLGLSLAETIILYELYDKFLNRNTKATRLYNLGLVIYLLFQFSTYWFKSPLFSMASFYLVSTVVISLLFFSNSLRVKILVAYLYVLLNYSCKLISAVFTSRFNLDILPLHPYSLVQSPIAQILSCFFFFF